MINRSLEKVEMKVQAPEIRINNFDEVAMGYTLEEAKEEALRCLGCKHKPCVKGCPVNVPIPGFIKALSDGNIEEAYEILTSQNKLPAICGRVCPQEVQCESLCVRGRKGEPVAIGRLERFVADYARENFQKQEEIQSGKKDKIAVVGSGPAGLTCAARLAELGYDVTIFEALHKSGGVLVYGIPEFRLPKKLVENEINDVKKLGIKIINNVIVGNSLLLEDIFADGYKAVFIGSGAGLPSFLGIDGEDYNGVYSANEFLTRVNLMKAYLDSPLGTPIKIGDKVAVVGGGNVAMDAARTAKRLGAESVYIVYRRGEEELPARLEEVHHAKEEGIIFKLLNNPVEIKGDENNDVKSMVIQKMELGEADASGRRRPVPIEGAFEEIPITSAIIAIGQSPNPILGRAEKDLKLDDWGRIIVNEETLETSMDNVYAGGDVVTGAATVILAMGAGKQAAEEIHERLTGSK